MQTRGSASLVTPIRKESGEGRPSSRAAVPGRVKNRADTTDLFGVGGVVRRNGPFEAPARSARSRAYPLNIVGKRALSPYILRFMIAFRA